MINLSQLARQSNEISLFEKIKSLRRLEIYLAENIRDYHENAPKLKFPWYKRDILFRMDYDDRAYISIMNVKLETLKEKGEIEIPNWFLIHDDTGKDVVYWDSEGDLLPASHSFVEAQEEQCLRDGDWIYDILLRYLIKKDLPSIIEVRKYNFSRKKPEKDSLLDRVKDLLPVNKPLPQSI